MTPDLSDEQITERIAEEVVARVTASHPSATSQFRRILVALYTAQATGAELPPGRITDARLATYFGEAPQRISEARASGLARAWREYHERFPELL